MGVLYTAAFHAAIPSFVGWFCGHQKKGVMNAMTQRDANIWTSVAGVVSGIWGVVSGDPSYAILDAIAALVGWIIGMVLAARDVR